MIDSKTYTGNITSETTLWNILVYIGGGNIRFTTQEQLYEDGVPIGVGDMQQIDANFADLPATFPVIINGQTVQVAGQTILDALESVAKAVIATQPQE